ncbi:MAG: DinB family protein [Longimicrobiales bacterium]|nr:DinB family protein [Longimicrobiales bacterium]
MTPRTAEPLDPTRSLVEAFLTNERVNQVLLELLDPAIWRAYPPCSKRRDHEAHHRGQITHWARELGSPIEPEEALRLWEWDKLWKEVRA